MNEAKTIVKNSLWLIIGEVLGKIAIFFLIIILARKVSVADFGKYNLALSFVMIFSVISDLGLNIFLFREIARNRELLSKYVSNVLVMRIILSIVFTIVVYIFARIFNYPPDVMKLIYLFIVHKWFFNFIYVFRTSFKAMERMKWDAIINTLDNTSRFLFTVVFLNLGMGIYSVGMAYALSTFLIFCFSLFIFISYFAKLNFRFDYSVWSFALKEMRFLAFVAILIPIFGKFDAIIIAHFSGPEAVGFYGAALKLVWMLIMAPSFITQAVFPRLSQSAFKKEDRFRNSISYLLKTNFLLTFLASSLIFLLANPIIQLVYGTKYLASVSVLQILIWCLPFHGLSGVFIYGLNARNKQKVNAIFIGSAILLNILLAIALAPKFSYIGVSFATLSGSIILFILFLFYYVKNSHISLKKLKFDREDIQMIKKIFSKEVAS